MSEVNSNKPNWLGKENSTRYRSNKQEKDLAKKFGGRTTSNSGARFGENDVKSDKFEVEAKTTKSKQFILKLEDLHKMQRKCRVTKKAVFVIQFEETGEQYALTSLIDFLDLSGLDKLK